MKDFRLGKVQVGCSRRIIAAFVAQGELQLSIKPDMFRHLRPWNAIISNRPATRKNTYDLP
jgi:hypothetical protein